MVFRIEPTSSNINKDLVDLELKFPKQYRNMRDHLTRNPLVMIKGKFFKLKGHSATHCSIIIFLSAMQSADTFTTKNYIINERHCSNTSWGSFEKLMNLTLTPRSMKGTQKGSFMSTFFAQEQLLKVLKVTFQRLF